MDSDRRSAANYLNEALELDPDNREARLLLNQLEGSEAIKEFESPIMEDDYNDIEPIDLDAADIVEEIPIDSEDLLIEGGLTINDRQLEEPYTDSEPEWSPNKLFLSSENGQGKERHDKIPADIVEPKGIIEVSGEYRGAMANGPSEVIHLGEKARLTDLQMKAYQDEESSRIEDDLEEAEFFIQQNLISEARAILEEVASRVPNHPLVEAKIAEIDDLEDKANITIIEEEPSSIRLANEMANTDFGDLGPAPTSSEYSVEDVFEEVKKGTDVQTNEEDFDTHYDLGIAYREMGLLDDAITEFKVAMRSREKEVLCHMMIGLCYIQKEMISEAISQFKTGLYVEEITDRETIALFFELGQAYENLDDLREALYYYEKVAKKNPQFRNVANRVQQIQNQGKKDRLGGDDNDGGGNPDPSGDDDIVSKVL
jgi:tetratricopeptide (TPR) repeat protein